MTVDELKNDIEELGGHIPLKKTIKMELIEIYLASLYKVSLY